jgi:electron transfer flavoprotein alpha subunit
MFGVTRIIARSSARGLSSASRNASTLVVAEHDGKNVSAASLATITAASKIGGDVDVLVVGSVGTAGASAAAVSGVRKALTADNILLANNMPEDLAAAVVHTVKSGGYTHVFTPASNIGKNFLPRAAAMMDSSPLSDILTVESEDTFTRPMYAGNAISTVQMTDSIKFLMVRTTAFEKAAETGGSGTVEAVSLTDSDITTNHSKFVSEDAKKSARPDLGSASVVISGGRGMKNGENFAMLETMADKLGGAVGASRAAVDAGYVPNELQVGQTGKVVAPDLYVAVGISGAIQHLSGMKDSKTIVAINKDKEAPIFQVSDYGLVADLFTAVPEMNEKL